MNLVNQSISKEFEKNEKYLSSNRNKQKDPQSITQRKKRNRKKTENKEKTKDCYSRSRGGVFLVLLDLRTRASRDSFGRRWE